MVLLALGGCADLHGLPSLGKEGQIGAGVADVVEPGAAQLSAHPLQLVFAGEVGGAGGTDAGGVGP